MRSIFRSICLCLTAVAIWSSTDHVLAQLLEYDFQPTAGVHDWNVGDNWLRDGSISFVPDIDATGGEGESAHLNTEATAQVSAQVPRVGQLDIENGVVLIDTSGELETAVSAGTSGAVVITRAGGRLEVRDNGQLRVGTVLSSVGDFHVYGPDASVNVASDMLAAGSVLGAHITGDTHSTITVGGTADLSGTLEVEVTGVAPTLGTSWDLVTATGGIDRMFTQIVVGDAPPIARGLQYRAVQTGNSAALEVGNTLIVTVDRQTGATVIENTIGSGLTLASYALRSDAGTLAPSGAQSLNDSGVAGTGWSASPATGQLIAEVKPDSTFTLGVGQSVSLGHATVLGVVPDQEDIQFDFTTTDGQVFSGITEYTGALNDFVLFVDPSDGSAAVGNLSSFISAPDLTGYAILSPENQLVPGGWTPFETTGEAGAGWVTSPALTSRLAELNLEDSHLFFNSTLIELGQIFTAAGIQDLDFLYTVAGETEQRVGSVVYGAIPDSPTVLAGDYNNGGQVEQGDLDLVLLNWGKDVPPAPDGWDNPDFQPTEPQIDQDDLDGVLLNWGNSAASSSTAVPEPASLLLIVCGAVWWMLVTGRAARIS